MTLNTKHSAFIEARNKAREDLAEIYTPEVIVLWETLNKRNYQLIKHYLKEIDHD